MINKTLVVSAYILDDMSGSEPTSSFHFIEKISKNFKSVLVLTSSFTPPEVMTKLIDSCKNVKFMQTQFPLFFPQNRFGIFYMKYRIFLMRQANQIQKLNLSPSTHIGIHYSLSNHLLGTALYKSGIPYLFGPASTSKFPFRYSRIAQGAVISEWIRFLCIKLVLRCDSVLRKSIRNARIILAGDVETQKLLRRSAEASFIYSSVIPHTCVDTNQIDEYASQSEDRKDLLWCGAYSNRKDPKMALEIMRYLVEIHGLHDIRLEMYGTGRKFKKLIRYQKRHALKNVEIHPWIKKDILIGRMSQTKVLLMTSFRETGGVQLLEAIACGMNVVSTDATSAKEWLSGSSLSFVGPTWNLGRKEFSKKLADEVVKQYHLEYKPLHINQFTVTNQVYQITQILCSFN